MASYLVRSSGGGGQYETTDVSSGKDERGYVDAYGNNYV